MQTGSLLIPIERTNLQDQNLQVLTVPKEKSSKLVKFEDRPGEDPNSQLVTKFNS